MRETRMSLPVLAMIGATRGMLGVGIGLLLASRFGRKRRRAVGSMLAAVGGLATIPLAFKVFGGNQTARTAQPTTTSSRPRAQADDAVIRH